MLHPVIAEAAKRLEAANPHLDPEGILEVLQGDFCLWMTADALVDRSMRRYIPSRKDPKSIFCHECGKLVPSRADGRPMDHAISPSNWNACGGGFSQPPRLVASPAEIEEFLRSLAFDRARDLGDPARSGARRLFRIKD